MSIRTLAMTIAVLWCNTWFTMPSAWAMGAGRDYYVNNGSSNEWTVVSYGDSIPQGFCGIGCSMPSYVEYFTHLNPVNLGKSQGININGAIKAVAGMEAYQIWEQIQMSAELAEEADLILVDACGNNFLPARKTFRGTCEGQVLHRALKNCKDGMESILRALHQLGKSKGSRIRVMNLYYPGVNDDRADQCDDGVQNFDAFLSVLAESNWHTCDSARQMGIPCADAFAAFNAADIDSTGEGISDREKLSWIPGESLSDYRHRITSTYRDLITDPRQKKTKTGTINLMQSDNTHPNKKGHSLIGQVHLELGLN